RVDETAGPPPEAAAHLSRQQPFQAGERVALHIPDFKHRPSRYTSQRRRQQVVSIVALISCRGSHERGGAPPCRSVCAEAFDGTTREGRTGRAPDGEAEEGEGRGPDRLSGSDGEPAAGPASPSAGTRRRVPRRQEHAGASGGGRSWARGVPGPALGAGRDCV